MTSTRPSRRAPKHGLSLMLVSMFTLQLLVPIVSATGMGACVGDGTGCDTYDHADDMTPHQQDWVEGIYDFELISTSSIELELTWAIREFDRDSLGFGSGTTVGNTLESTDGLDANDGAPADLIRHYFDTSDGSTTVGQKLQTEVHQAIEDALESGFGSVTSLSTAYINSFTNSGQTTTCSFDPVGDSQAEGAAENNVFEPPICFQATAAVDLVASNFNLVGSENLDLERTYRGLLTMGAEVNTSFDLTAKAGHKADFVISPSSYSTVLGTDVNGTLVARAGPPNYMAAEWSIDHLTDETGDDKVMTVDLRMGHRNSTDTPTVYIEPGSKAIDLNLVLDLSDEYAATIDFAAGLSYLDTDTLNNWGINMFEVSSSASIPVVTSDGIRLAYHNDIVDLTQFTDQFPVGDIVEGLGNTIAGVGDITMSDLQWVSTTDGTGIFDSEGGLNYSHSTGCSEPIAAGQVLHYCLEGTNAMNGDYPIYLQTTSQPFSMRFIDIIIAQMDEENHSQGIDFLENVQSSDLERLMNAGFSIEALIGESFLNAIDLNGLPPADLTVEIILPNWVTTVDGTSTIVLTKTVDQSGSLNLSLTGLDPYDWEHEIIQDDGTVVCHANQSTCIQSDVKFDLSNVNFNEWSASFSVSMALEAELSIYRIGFVDGQRCFESENIEACGQMEAFPSDLLRLIIDLSSRMESPLATSLELPWCESADAANYYSDCDPLELQATRQGMKDFSERLGLLLTDFIHGQAGLYEDGKKVINPEEPDYNPFKQIDLSAFNVVTSISGIEAPDEIVSDDEPITFSVSIPEVEFTIGSGTGWGEISETAPEDLKISIVTSSIQSIFHQPVQMAADVLTKGLRGSFVGSDGVTLTEPGQDDFSYSQENINTSLPTEFDTGEFGGVIDSPIDDAAYTGPITFTLPRGIKFVDVSSSAGNIIITEDGGRQTITYVVPAGEFSDDVSFRVQIGWIYFLIQFWVYPTIVLLLLVMFIRRRRAKKKKKKAAMANRQAAVTKAQLGDHEFADLTGFSSPALRHGESIEDMANIDELSR